MENNEIETLENCDQPQEILDSLYKMKNELKGFILFSGKNGTGKSYAAKATYNAVCPYKPPYYDHDVCIFKNQTEMNLEYNEHQKKYGETNSFLKEIRKTKLLVFDDVGTRTPSDVFMDFIYAFIDYRYNNKLATIITTNLNAIDMRAKFGDAFVSRVASGTVFKLEGKDRRFKDF